MEFEYIEENTDGKLVSLDKDFFLFAACCLRQSFENEDDIGKIAQLQENFGCEAYRKFKKENRNKSGKARSNGKLKLMLVENYSSSPRIDWGDEEVKKGKTTNFRMDIQNSDGRDVNLSIQAGDKTIATVLFAREYCGRYNEFRGGMDRPKFFRAVCDALLKSLGETMPPYQGAVKAVKRYRVKEKNTSGFHNR